MKELLTKLGLDIDLSGDELLERLKEMQEEILEQLNREQDAELLRQVFEWFHKAAEQGNAEAQFELGEAYDDGVGVEQDYSRAAEWYRKAAEQGYAEAQNSLGACYYNGSGVAKDQAKAVEWFQKAAEQANVMAQFNMGLCYEYGTGVPVDKTKAVEWYRKAAEQDNQDAKKALERLGG